MTEPHYVRYDYRDCPTIERFSEDDSFIRGLMGPFGCLPFDTEFLTPAGWKRMCDYQSGDRVAQWHEDGRIEFVEPTKHIVLPCTEFIEFDSGSLVMQLSGEHRVPHYNWTGRFSVSTAAEIARHPSKRTIPTTFVGPDGHGLGMSDDLIRFAVMMHADGHYTRQGNQAVVTLRKERKKERGRALLRRLGIEFAERVYPRRPDETLFVFYPPYRGKRFDERWWTASRRELSVVLDEMSHWDGLADHEEVRYFTTHKADADFIQYAAHATGRRAAIHRTEYENEEWRDSYSVNIRTSDNPKNRAQVRVDTTKISRFGAYDGLKYCFIVPTGFFVARCADTIFITGNSGKSSGCVVEIVNRGLAHPVGVDGWRRSRWGVVRNTYPELRDTTIKTIFQWFPPQYFGRYVENKHSYVIKAFDKTEIELVFLALDRPDDVKKLLSLELTGGWINEAREVPWAVIDAFQGRVGRYPAKRDCVMPFWYGLWMDTNPPDADSKWYKFFEEMKHPKGFARLFKQPGGLEAGAENLSNLPGGRRYYTNLSTGKAAEWNKIYVDGKYGFIVEGKLVYPEYNDAFHCRKADPVPGRPVIRSWDFGLTPACAFSQILPTGQWLTFDELTSDNMSVDEFGDVVLDHCARAFKGQVQIEDWGDPAGENRHETDKRSAFDILQAKGINIQAARSQEPTLRQESVRRPLRLAPGGEPSFILHPRCRMLRKGFMGGYHRRRLQVAGPERYSEKPEKNEYSHIHDALQYGMVEYFAPALVDIQQNEDDFWERPDYGGVESRDDHTGY
jgi:hypothetical protein